MAHLLLPSKHRRVRKPSYLRSNNESKIALTLVAALMVLVMLIKYFNW
jgi:hypothetical protein